MVVLTLLEPTKEDKEAYNKNMQEKISNLEKKTESTMNATEYKKYSNELDKLTKKSDDPKIQARLRIYVFTSSI